MTYNIIDLLDKIIAIYAKQVKVYENMKNDGGKITALSIITNVFIAKDKKEIKYYEDIKKRINEENISEIDFFIYDKVSSLMAEFIYKIEYEKIDDVRNLINTSLDMHKNLRALLIDVRGRLIKKLGDGEKIEYKILTDTIDREEKIISQIEKL